MIIGISGKLQSGKDEVAKMIEYWTNITLNTSSTGTLKHYIEFCESLKLEGTSEYYWEIRRFADKLKQIVSLLTGYSIEDLEKEEIKNKPLGENWICYGYADGFIKKYIGDGNFGEQIMIHKECSKEEYEEHLKTNWQTAYKHEYTIRELLQLIGTNLFRNQILEDIHVNGLFADYKGITKTDFPESTPIMEVLTEADEVKYRFIKIIYPNWLIPDVRFPNEVKRIEKEKGFVIRVTRPLQLRHPSLWNTYVINHASDHTEITFKEWLKSYNIKQYNRIYADSEIALDNHPFIYNTDNNGDLQELLYKVRDCLIEMKVI